MQDRWKQAGQAVVVIAILILAVWQPWAPPAPDGLPRNDAPPQAKEKTNARPSREKPGIKLPRDGHTQTPTKNTAQEAEIGINTEHILRGQINSRGDLVGMHHRPSAPKTMRVGGTLCNVEITATSPGDDDAVVTAHIRLIDAQTDRVVREKNSTLYPASWSEAKILAAIRAAYVDAVTNDKVNSEGFFTGRAEGLRIDGYLTRDGEKINTAYPVLPAGRGMR